MRIILDESIPQPLMDWLAPHQVSTVQREGWAGIENGKLLAKISPLFDIFITADKNLRYQQNLVGRSIAILELPTNRLPLLESIREKITAAIGQMKLGDYKNLTL